MGTVETAAFALARRWSVARIPQPVSALLPASLADDESPSALMTSQEPGKAIAQVLQNIERAR